MTGLQERATAFLYREAWLADSNAYREWLSLWAEDCLYWIPCNDDDSDPETHVAIIYERLGGLEDRVRRLSGGSAFAQQPQSRLSRIISNIIVSPASSDGLVETKSVFNITAFRRGTFETFAGRAVHQLRETKDGFTIVRKTVYLINNDGYIGNMSFLV